MKQDQNRNKPSLDIGEDSSSNAEKSLEATKNRAGASEKSACGNAKVTQDQNRHKLSINSDEDSSSNAEESLEAAKNRAGGSQNSAHG